MARIFTLSAAAALIANSICGVVAAPEHDKRAYTLPDLAQAIDQKSFNVLPKVPTAEEYNGSSVSPSSRTPGFTMLTMRNRRRGPHQTRAKKLCWRNRSTSTMPISSTSSVPTRPLRCLPRRPRIPSFTRQLCGISPPTRRFLCKTPEMLTPVLVWKSRQLSTRSRLRRPMPSSPSEMPPARSQ